LANLYAKTRDANSSELQAVVDACHAQRNTMKKKHTKLKVGIMALIAVFIGSLVSGSFISAKMTHAEAGNDSNGQSSHITIQTPPAVEKEPIKPPLPHIFHKAHYIPKKTVLASTPKRMKMYLNYAHNLHVTDKYE